VRLNRNRQPAAKLKPRGEHGFVKVSSCTGIEHSLTPPRHPQTNAVVKRLTGGRISNLLQQTQFDTRADL
jgi:transposase InsO family protein